MLTQLGFLDAVGATSRHGHLMGLEVQLSMCLCLPGKCSGKSQEHTLSWLIA